MRTLPIALDETALAAFCRRYGVRELSLFGSILRDDFGPASDVDVSIALRPDTTMTLEAHLAMREELSRIFAGREVDMVRQEYLKKPYRKAEIMRTREVVYAECPPPMPPTPADARALLNFAAGPYLRPTPVV